VIEILAVSFEDAPKLRIQIRSDKKQNQYKNFIEESKKLPSAKFDIS